MLIHKWLVGRCDRQLGCTACWNPLGKFNDRSDRFSQSVWGCRHWFPEVFRRIWGFPSSWGTPIYGWFLLGKIPSRNGWSRGTPISGNLHLSPDNIVTYRDCSSTGKCFYIWLVRYPSVIKHAHGKCTSDNHIQEVFATYRWPVYIYIYAKDMIMFLFTTTYRWSSHFNSYS